jgi:hypothetical protein
MQETRGVRGTLALTHPIHQATYFSLVRREMRRRRVLRTYIYKSSPDIIERRPESRTIELLSAAMFSNILPLIYSVQKRLQRVPAAHGSSQLI